MYLYNSILVFLFLFSFFAYMSATLTYGFDPITNYLLTDERQIINQTNTCEEKANCDNKAVVRYFAFSENGTLISSTSDQTVTQFNQCSNDANCMNAAFLTNQISGLETLENDSKITPNLNQACYKTSGNCLNYNEMTGSASGTGSAFLDYVSSQSNQSGTENNNSKDQ